MSDYELHHGDMLEVMPTLAKGSVACVFADLPYGVTNSCKWDILVDQARFWANIRSVLRDDGICLLTANMALSAVLLQHATIRFAYDLVWQKTRPVGFYNARKMPLRAHEHVLCFYSKPPTYNPQMRTNTSGRKGKFLRSPGRPAAYGTAKLAHAHTLGAPLLPHSVLTVASPHAERGKHPTQKPLALLEWLIATYTNPGDTVLDPCFGSGTTGVACANLSRKFIGIEKDAGYFATGKARIEKAFADAAAGPRQTSLAV